MRLCCPVDTVCPHHEQYHTSDVMNRNVRGRVVAITAPQKGMRRNQIDHTKGNCMAERKQIIIIQTQFLQLVIQTTHSNVKQHE
jgi:hypothetical protein